MSRQEFKKLYEVNEEERVKYLEKLSGYLRCDGFIDVEMLGSEKEAILERMVTHPDFNCEIAKSDN